MSLEVKIKWILDTYTEVDENAAKKMQNMLDLVDDKDDVQEFCHNAEFQ